MNKTKIDDNAQFCLDLILCGHPIHVADNKIYMCRKNEAGQWQNAIIYYLIQFPDSEIVDEIAGCIYTSIWISVRDWKLFDLTPNLHGLKAYDLVKSLMKVSRDLNDEQLIKLIGICSNHTYAQAKAYAGGFDDSAKFFD